MIITPEMLQRALDRLALLHEEKGIDSTADFFTDDLRDLHLVIDYAINGGDDNFIDDLVEGDPD